MLKIKDTLIKRIYSNNLTKYELITLLELIKISDEEGIANVYYKEIVNTIGCNTSTFYNVINSLKDKNFIEFEKNQEYKKEMIIGVCDNYFKDNFTDYVNINNVIMYGDLFHHLRAGEIRMLLYFIFKISKQKYSSDVKSIYHDKNRIRYKVSYKSISKILNITVRMTKIYIKKLLSEKIISIGENINMNNRKFDIITVSKKIMETPKELVTQKGVNVELKTTDKRLHYKNSVKNICRRNNILINNSIDLNNTATLMAQYFNKAVESGKDIYKVVNSAVKQLKNNILESKSLHYIIKTLVNKDYNESIIVY